MLVLVAQERMAYNFIYTFKGKDPKIPWTSEIRSFQKGGSNYPSLFKILIKIDANGNPKIFCRIKYVKKVMII